MRVWIGDLMSGRSVQELPFTATSWTDELNVAETITATIDVTDPFIRRLNLRNLTIPGKTYLVVQDEGICEGGPIWTTDYDHFAGTVKLNATGILSYFAHRQILPTMPSSGSVVNSDGTDNTAYDTTLTNLDAGTIVKRYLVQALSWPSTPTCITFPADGTGALQDSVKASDLKTVLDKVKDQSDNLTGCDFKMVPSRTTDNLGFTWLLVVGSPRITNSSPKLWDATIPNSPISALTVTTDATAMASHQWETCTNSTSQQIVARSISAAMTTAGWPMLEAVETGSTSVTSQATAQSHSDENLRTSTAPTESWAFSVRRGADLGFEYQAGWPCQIKTAGDPWIPDGWYSRRIVSLSGGTDSDDIKVTTGVAYG